jgi:hypothetical protein
MVVGRSVHVCYYISNRFLAQTIKKDVKKLFAGMDNAANEVVTRSRSIERPKI